MIFGAGGILGNAFLTKLGNSGFGNGLSYRIFAFEHSRADITDPNHINPIMEYVRPSVVINCAAINDEDLCQEAKSGSFAVNAKGPQLLAESCKKFGAKFIHFSSASVFDGEHCNPYSERHTTKPVNILGQSKLSGEIAIKENADDYLIIRPGWVFSYENPSCIPTWISQAERNEEIAVIDDYYGSPTYVVDLVDATMDLITHDAKGIFHIANSEAASRQSFLEATLELSQLKTRVVAVKAESQKGFKAPVPKYTVLSSKKFSQLANRPMRSWVDALKHCLFNMHRYKP